MPLLPVLPLISGESLPSYIARMASFHAGMDLFSFNAFMGLSQNALMMGSTEVLNRVASLSGLPLEDVQRSAICTEDSTYARHRGERFRKTLVNRGAVFFCPRCLLEDRNASDRNGHRVGRNTWLFSAVRTCPEHRLALAELRGMAPKERIQSLELIAPADDELRQLADSLAHRDVSPLQAYIQQRLSGRPGPRWLDSQSMDQAVWNTQMLGHYLLRGSHAQHDGLTEDQWDEAGRAGFSYTSRGAEGVRECLDQISAPARAQNSPVSPSMAFGGLLRSVSKTPYMFGPLKLILRDTIMDTVPAIIYGDLLGEPVKTRRKHRVDTLAAEVGVQQRPLKELLIDHGLLPVDPAPFSHANLTFDPAKGLVVAQQLRRSITVANIPRHFNCDPAAAKMLVEDGYITRLGRNRSMRRKQSLELVDTASFTGFLDRVFAMVRPDLEPDLRPMGLSEAAKMFRWPVGHLVKLVLNGKLSKIGRSQASKGFASIMVDGAEIEELLFSKEEHRGVGKQAAADALQIQPRSVEHLLRLTDDKGAPLIKRVHLASGRRDEILLDDRTFQKFRKRHVSLLQLATRDDLAPEEVRLNLSKRGIESILRTAWPDDEIYRISDL